MTDGPHETPNPSPAPEGAVNFAQMEKLIKDKGRREQMLQQYVTGNRSDAGALREAVEARDPGRIMRAAHRIKGAAKVVGADALAEATYTVELAGRNGSLDGITEKLDQVMAEVARVERAVVQKTGMPLPDSADDGAGASSPTTGSDRNTALIVEPMKMFVDLLVQALRNAQLHVEGATSAREATGLFERLKPDLVIVESNIEDGRSFLEAIRGGLKPPTIVALVDSDETADQARATGFDRIVDKRSGFHSLIDAIRHSVNLDLSGQTLEEGDLILVVDDDPTIRSVVSENLRGRGYVVHTAESGNQALEVVARESSIKVVLMDVSMPGMGGMEALRQIIKTSPHPQVIMLTGVEDRDIAQQAIQIGAFDYVVKSSDPNVLESSITACLEHAEYRKQPWWRKIF